MDDANVGSQWYALQVRPRFEKVVSVHLQNKGYEGYLPLYRSSRRLSDRTKEVDLPLFPGYLFCKFEFNRRLPILVIPGVITVVTSGKNPASVSEEEIMAVQNVVKSGLSCEPSGYITVGQQVRVERGPLRGVVGIVVETKKNLRLVVSVHLLQRSVSVDIESDNVIPIGTSVLPPAKHAADLKSTVRT